MKRLIVAVCVVLGMADLAGATIIRRVPLPGVRDLAYDAAGGRIYASVGSRDANSNPIPDGNSIKVIDPVAGTVGPAITVGGGPGRLALSDDGRYLYMTMSGESTVMRYDASAKDVDLQIQLSPSGQTNPYTAIDIAALPGQPQAVAVSMGYVGSTGFGGLRIYDNDVRRPQAIGIGYTCSNIEFGETASTLYAHNSLSSGNEFYRLQVNADGVSIIDNKPNLLGPISAEIRYQAGRLCSTSGVVINPDAKEVVGTCPLNVTSSDVLPDAAHHRVFFAGYNSTSGKGGIQTFDIDTFQPIRTLWFNEFGSASNLLRWGADGLAFTTSSELWLVQGTIVPEPATLSVLIVAGGYMAIRRQR